MSHSALYDLARSMGVYTDYTDGLGRAITPPPETLVRICASLGAPISNADEAADALRAREATLSQWSLPSVMVAWDGDLRAVMLPPEGGAVEATLHLEDGEALPLEQGPQGLTAPRRLPWGYHTLRVERGAEQWQAAVIGAPVQSWRRPGVQRSWGVGTHLAALRSARSRSIGDIRDLEAICGFIRERGGDLVTVLPLLPTFNEMQAEPSPYSPVSRLFWSELVLDLGASHRPVPPPQTLDVIAAHREVEAALAALPLHDHAAIDPELARYARFRGAQARYGRNWRDWPAEARAGRLVAGDVDAAVERFHLSGQLHAREQLHALRERLDPTGMRIGLDLAVGVHPDGYDPWSRQKLFCDGMAVGAPPDRAFPSGQDWGFTPVLPEASRRDGHRYIAASIAHQAGLAGVLRVDHIMALTRLYWIPQGFGLGDGTYVTYPADELFAVMTLESHRHHCEIVGENLGTVAPDIGEAMPRHQIWGMYVAIFQTDDGPHVTPPSGQDMALIGTHDTPTFAGWIGATDVADRVQHGLLDATREGDVRAQRAQAARWLAEHVGSSPDTPKEYLGALLDWLGHSASPLVVTWLEDLWLEDQGVNLPGTRSSERPNWQRPMRRLLDDVFADPEVDGLLRRLDGARRRQ